jgi:hypothetical protein
VNVPLRRVTRIKRALKRWFLTPLPPVWLWKQTPKQRERDRKLRLWAFIALLVIATLIHGPPIITLVLLAVIVCGAVVAFFLQRSHRDDTKNNIDLR